jgi:multidrug efflux pump subunit AcrA (membrane-fusion protein)
VKKIILTGCIFALATSFVCAQTQIRKSTFQASLNTFYSQVSGGDIESNQIYNGLFVPINNDMIQQNNYVAKLISTDSIKYNKDTTYAGTNSRAAAAEQAQAAADVKAATLNLQKAKTDKTLQSNLTAANAALANANKYASLCAAYWLNANKEFTAMQALRAQRNTGMGAFSGIAVLKGNWRANLTKIENDLNTYVTTLN